MSIRTIVGLAVVLGFRLVAGPLEEWSKMKPMVPRGYLCVRTTNAPNIDGQLDEAAWQRAPWTEEFVDIRGPSQPKPWFPTRAKMLWDDQYFYIAAQLTEPHVWATITQRDAVIFQDNDFEVFIDPDGDAHQYYEFEMNALNTVWDLRLVKPYKDGGPALNEWDIAGLKTAVHIEGTLNDSRDLDRHWTVEIALPWKALGEYSKVAAPPQDGDRWRVDFSRVEWKTEIVNGRYQKVPQRPEENWVWSPTGIVDMHRPEKWGLVEFSTSTQGGRSIKPGPTEVARDQLQEIYYRQRGFRESQHRYAKDRKELALEEVSFEGCSIQKTPEGYEATVPIRRSEIGSTRTGAIAHIREDARFWITP